MQIWVQLKVRHFIIVKKYSANDRNALKIYKISKSTL